MKTTRFQVGDKIKFANGATWISNFCHQ